MSYTSLTNCPTKVAFMMEVYCPLTTTIDNEETSAYIYRVRKILTYTGEEYTQYVCSYDVAGVYTYSAWKKTAKYTGNLYPWKLLASESGTTGTITLPTEYSELHILIGISNYMYTFDILADYLTTTAQMFRNSYALSTTVYGDVYVSLTKTQITAWTVRKENVVQTATIKVYYR